MSRSCARPGCAEGAVATLSYAYADSDVWLEDLAEEGHPMTHDLCDLHAGSIRVPRGWDLHDTRRADVSDTTVVPDTAAVSNRTGVSDRTRVPDRGVQGELRLVGA